MTKRPTIQEVPNPAYVKMQKERRTFLPFRGSILVTQSPAQPSLKEQMEPGYKRYETDPLVQIREICDICSECMDCAYSGEMVAIDRCRVVKANVVVRK